MRIARGRQPTVCACYGSFSDLDGRSKVGKTQLGTPDWQGLPVS